MRSEGSSTSEIQKKVHSPSLTSVKGLEEYKAMAFI